MRNANKIGRESGAEIEAIALKEVNRANLLSTLIKKKLITSINKSLRSILRAHPEISSTYSLQCITCKIDEKKIGLKLEFLKNCTCRFRMTVFIADLDR